MKLPAGTTTISGHTAQSRKRPRSTKSTSSSSSPWTKTLRGSPVSDSCHLTTDQFWSCLPGAVIRPRTVSTSPTSYLAKTSSSLKVGW